MPPDWPELGPRFRVLDKLGKGGMGTVYRAFDTSLGREVALKVLHSTHPESRAQLKTEFRALSNIAHPNLVTLYELVADERSCFFTMELLAGTDFASYVRSLATDGSEVEPQVRAAACQLALGLCALHADGKLHRDVKPSNVMVTEAARVVLLDFGLATPLRIGTTSLHERAGLVGTIPYMAPEQAWGEDIGPAADWYAFGVTLYEAMTGRLPITGAPAIVVQAKKSFVPKSLRESGVDVSSELDDLVSGLLRANPLRRPDGAGVLTCLGGSGAARRSWLPSMDSRRRPHPLLGRETELGRLRDLLAEVRAGAARIVTIEGQSGIGKTSLVRRFVEELDTASALVLRSQCHPQETVAFNAIDGWIDELCEWLADAPTPLRFFPEPCSELLLLFPALARFTAIQGADSRSHSTYSRRQAFAQLRDLFSAVAAECPLVLWVDDLQWGDEESGVLLRELLSARHAPRILTVACVRAEDREHSDCLRVLAESDLERLVARIALRPLGADDATQLVQTVAPDTVVIAPAVLADLVQQSGGSPFLLTELGRYLASVSSAPDDLAGRGIGEVLGQRTESLEEKARHALEVLAVAGSPLEQESALRAAGLGDGDREVYAVLERLFLARTVATRRRAVEVYHHQVRDMLLRRMPESIRAERHRAIGHALVLSAKPNIIAAIEHFEAGGDIDYVRRYVVPAADEAAGVLAFERAARLYQRALELGGTGTAVDELERRLAVTLASAGRGLQAGEAYERAAAALERRSNADPQHVLELRYRAAEQFIQTDHNQRGSAILRDVLDRVGVPLPRSRGEARGKMIALRLAAIGLELTNRAGNVQATASDFWRFDAMRAVGMRLAVVDHDLADYASAWCMKDAARRGDILRLVRALASEGTTWSHIPWRLCQHRGIRLLERASALLPPEAAPYDRACLLASSGIAASFRGEYRRTESDIGSAVALLRTHSRARVWEISLWRVWQFWALAQLGEFRELRRLTSEDLADAVERDDRFAERNATLGAATQAWLADDRADALRERAEVLLRRMPSAYSSGRWQYFLTMMDLDLYQGLYAEAWARARVEWPLLRKNGFLFLSDLRDAQLDLRARAAVGAAARGARALDGARPLDPLNDAIQAARRLSANGLAPGRASALLVLANVAHVKKDDGEARRLFAEASQAFDAAGMAFHREVSRYCLGRVTTSEEGTRAIEQAEGWMRREGIVNPRAMIRAAAPVFVE